MHYEITEIRGLNYQKSEYTRKHNCIKGCVFYRVTEKSCLLKHLRIVAFNGTAVRIFVDYWLGEICGEVSFFQQSIINFCSDIGFRIDYFNRTPKKASSKDIVENTLAFNRNSEQHKDTISSERKNISTVPQIDANRVHQGFDQIAFLQWT